ncbi:restriction endonuclease subunit S [Enterococcus cecorum]|uniref:restriction endonuclease subunit S n=1 Tax=Enterococcus cecorum TaxID=44008 RepID=UPI00326478B3
MNEKKKLQPKVRFREFTGENAPDWEQRKFIDIVERLNKTEDNVKLPRIEFEDIVSGEGRLNKDLNTKKDDRKGIFFDENNILYGKLRSYLRKWYYARFAGVAIGDFWVLKIINNNHPLFIYYLIQTEKYQRVANDTSGTKMPRSDWKKVSESLFYIPNINEQKKISTIFNIIDNLITLHQRKLEQLEQLKNTLLSKMFPKSGTNIPEIRFSGFTDAWKQRKLKEMLEERNELILESKDYPLMSFVQGKGVIPKSNRYDRSFLVKNDKKKYKKTELNDFIYSSNNLETGSIGFNKTGNAVISPVYSIFKSKNKLESRFIGIISRRKDFIAKMLKFRQGVVYGQWKIDEDDFLNISVFTPNIETQKYIIDLFIIIDNYIAIHQRKLEQLKNLKQTLLNKMFI